MPTGARLVSAIVFALVAFVAARHAHGLLEANADATVNPGWMFQIMTVVGALCGWFVMGSRVGQGLRFAISAGLLTAVAILFWGLLIFSTYEMILLSTKMRYDGVTEAVIGVFDEAVKYGSVVVTPSLGVLLLIGGVIGGWAADWANRRYV